MPKKTVVSNFNAISNPTDNNKTLTYDLKTISKVFKGFFSNLAESLLLKQPNPSSKYNLESVFPYYSNFEIPKCCSLKIIQKKKFLK